MAGLTASWHRARLAAGILPYLRDPIGPDAARAVVRSRVATRERRFLDCGLQPIFSDTRSPHRGVLEAVGWDLGRLTKAVARDGLEKTLAVLRDEGVRTSLEEFKCRRPIVRDGVSFAPTETDFDNPRLRRSFFRAATGGTASPQRVTVAYDWGLFAEEAALECLLFEAHGCLDAPLAIWLPGLPSISGIHNVLVHLRFGRPPERWFSHLPGNVRARTAVRYLKLFARAAGLRVPGPEPTPPQRAERVALWVSGAIGRTGRAVLKTFAGSAVRVAEGARRLGLDLSGAVIFSGGEPLTEPSRVYIESTGAQVFSRYVATETGWIGAACPMAPTPSHMHLYSDRLAVIPGPDKGQLLFSAISPTAGKQLLNTDLGDAGRIGTRRCDCPLGQVGLEVELSDVHGHDKISAEGMTVAQSVVEQTIEEVIAERGGPPDAFRLSESEGPDGTIQIEVCLSHSLDGLSDRELIDSVLARLPDHGPDADLAARVWRQTGSVRISRVEPALTGSMKQPRFRGWRG